jgi:hypothetical protein
LSAFHQPGSLGNALPGIDDSTKMTADQSTAGIHARQPILHRCGIIPWLSYMYVF